MISKISRRKPNCNNVVECLNVGIGYPVRCLFAISISAHQFEQNKQKRTIEKTCENIKAINTFAQIGCNALNLDFVLIQRQSVYWMTHFF